MRAALVLAGCVLSLTAQAAAQADADGREPAFGLARTATGSPWAGARVVLVGRAHTGESGGGPVDRVEVETDAQGKFRAGVLPGLHYAAWAFESLEGGARQRVSDAVGGVVPRRPIFLTGSRFLQWRRTLRLDAADGVRGPFRVQIRSAEPVSWTEEIHVDGDGLARLPVVSPGRFEVRVADASGVWLSRHVETAWESAQAREFVVRVPARTPTRVSAWDVETGKGIGGAQVCAVQDGGFQPVGAVDADGCGQIDLPEGGVLFVVAPGFAPAALSSSNGIPVPPGEPGPPLRDGFVAERFAKLGSGSRLAGRFEVGRGNPLVDAWLLTEENGLFFHDARTRSLSRFARMERLGADGAFERDPVLLEFAPRGTLVLGPGGLAQLPAAWRAGLVPAVPALFELERRREGAEVDLGAIDLLAMLPVRFRVRSSGGVPLQGATVELVPVDQAPGRQARGSEVAVDQRGEALFLLPRNREVLLLVWRDGRLLDARIVWTAAGPPVAEPFALEVRTARPTTVTGQVVDADGQPVARGRVRWSWQAPDPREDAAAADRDAAPAGGDTQLPDRVAATLARRVLPATVPLDDEGHFRFEVPGIRGVVAVFAGRDRVEVPVVPGGVVEPIRLRSER